MEKNNSWNQHLFESLTVQQLKSFGKTIGLHGYYKLRKTELVTTIVAHLFEKDTIISFLWQQPLKTIALLKNFVHTEKIDLSSYEPETYKKPFFYLYLGYAETDVDFSEQDNMDHDSAAKASLNPSFRIVFEQWLKEDSASYFSQRKIIDYCIAAANLWGIAPLTEISKIYQKHHDEILPISQIKETLEQFPYGDTVSFSTVDDLIVSNVILKSNAMSYFLERKQGKPYYMPEKEIFLKYTYEYYVEVTMDTQAYSDFLTKKLGAYPLLAKKIVEETVALIETERPLHDMIDLLNKHHIAFENETQLGALISVLTNLTNNTRLWCNNGHTPNEIRSSVTNTPPPKKTGRNAPCPCGSGKKYKYCCGKNQL